MDSIALIAIVTVVVLAVVSLVLLRGRKGARSDIERLPPSLREPHEASVVPGTEPISTQAAVAPPEPVAPSAADPQAAPENASPPQSAVVPEPVATPAPEPVTAPTAPLSSRERFRLRLARARNTFGSSVSSIFGRGVDEAAWDDLEEALISADVGVEATMEMVEELRTRVREQGIRSGDEALDLLKLLLREELSKGERALIRRPEGTSVWLVTGVNGTGKTTSIGKLAARATGEGETIVLAAADTFRAAAAEQLELWGERAGARVIRNQQGADPAAVAYDGYAAAKAAGADLLIVDTAGRLQNKTALMAELGKVKRVLDREAGHIDEVLLVLDATTGQNGLAQAKAFLEAVSVTGVVLTKLDGTAKGGIVVAIQRQLGLPVKLVGLGEGIDDLALFEPDAFVEALFAEGAQGVDLEEDETT